ncbi:MAG: hypothetical protein K6F69_10220 [Treponema sp.]|nr:hypothetical protein [Treponema sp.]
MKKQMVAIAAAVLTTAFMSGCGGKKEVSVSTDKKYTYHAAVLAPNTWNPTDWKNHEEDVVLKNVVVPLYDFILNETKDGYDIIPEMAAEMPIDVTSEYAGNDIYGVPSDAKEGYAFKIKLNPLATWQDGTKINADTYIYSIKQFLNPEMKNFRGSSFYSESLVIANAKSYYDGGIAYDNIKTDSGYADVKDDDMWSSLSQKVVFFDDAIDSYNGIDNPDEWKADDGSDLWAKLKELAGEGTYFKVTPEIKAIYKSVAKKFGDSNPEAYKEFCFSRTELPPTPWENVGVVKNDDYTITLILGKAYTPFMFEYNSLSIRLVYEPLYEANKKKAGDIIKSSYGTNVDNFASYGPYKIVDYQADKYMKLERNENWYGYTDGKHDGQFQTTGWDFQYITDQPTRLNLFLQGKLDAVELSATDMDKYGNSEYRIDTPKSYTWKFSFNIDRKSLKKENTDGVNHTLIANKNFRHGVSLSLDRQKLTDTIDIAKTPAYGLISYLYVAEPETGLLYRNTEISSTEDVP